MMRVQSLGKLFLILLACLFITFITAWLRQITVNYSNNYKVSKANKDIARFSNLSYVIENGEELKFVLQWTYAPEDVPFYYMKKGRSVFIENKCEYTNCYVFSRKDHNIIDYPDADVIVFSGYELSFLKNTSLPKIRSPHQKYVFASIESPENYPVCSNRFDGYFNWTWTYRLDSESRWGYMVIRDSNGTVIGPRKEMHWMKLEDMNPVPEDLILKLSRKRKLAAWLVSGCDTKSKREEYVKELNKELRGSGFQVDIFGLCDAKKCSRANETLCDKMLEKDYFFYLAFENSFSEDYVTEKLWRPLKFNAIPVVYGGANYSRFMPDGIYLNAKELGVQNLTAKMLELALDFKKYIEYFKWKNHYSYHTKNERADTNDYCGFCALLNNERKMKEITVYEKFKEWWNPPNKRC